MEKEVEIIDIVKKKNRKFFEEFKAFALKGNVIDMAVGVIIATEFGKIVSSLVKDILMPLIGILIGGIDLTSLTVNVFGRVPLEYGNFLQSVINFVIIALSVFIFIKIMNSFMKKKEEVKEEKKPTDIALLEEIRDLLKK